MSWVDVFRTVAAAVALRALLLLLGAGSLLIWRVEVSTPVNSLLKLREGHALMQLGVSPYTGSSCHVPPLLLRVLGPLVQQDLLYALPNILFDLMAAAALLQMERTLRSAASRRSGGADVSQETYGWLCTCMLEPSRYLRHRRGIHVCRGLQG